MFEYSSYDLKILPTSFLIMIVVAIILRLTLKNKSDKVKEIPFIIVTAILVVLEIIKQILNATVWEFDLFNLPFHYCSLFVFFFPLAHFTKGKVKKFFTPVAFTTAFAMTLVFYFCPRGIIGNSTEDMFLEFKPFHSVTFHNLVIFYTILTFALGTYKPKKSHAINLMVTMLVYCAIAIPLAHILQTNYCNFLECTVPIVEDIQLVIGMFWYTVIMVIIIGFGPSLLSVIHHFIYSLIYKTKSKEQST